MTHYAGWPARPPGFAASDVTETIRKALTAAGLDTRAGPMKDVTDVIERALAGAGLMPPPGIPPREGVTIDGTAHVVDPPSAADASAARSARALSDHAQPDLEPEPALRPEIADPGAFVDGSFAGAAGARDYKVYVPAVHTTAREPLPVVVMLHGCTQSPVDFAAGTRMNALADEHGFIVVYPAQCARANGQKCWNWFRTEDQLRESGEPAIIAGITREVVARYDADPRRVFVAGMSAGAAMAVILGTTYPDLYAAVGAHSGLAYAAAHDMPSAFGAMQGGAGIRAPLTSPAVPTIVFHGDRDYTVSARNASGIVAQAIARPGVAPLAATTQSGIASGGRAYSRTVYADADQRSVVEHWILHGAGHAWSGGDAAGSHTDTVGPDASAEMVRFFLSQPPPGNA